MLKGHDPACRGTRHLTLLGHAVCNRGFQRLLGIGKGRSRNLNKAASEGQEVAPLDGRYLPKGPVKQSHKRSLVYDFLYNLYITAGEVLPDSAHSSSNKRPRQGSFKHDVKNLDRSKIRHLPPGKFTDYFRLCTAEFPQEKISKKLFTSAWDPRQTLLHTIQYKHY